MKFPRLFPETIEEIEAIASRGLATNPTITVYEMVDGVEFNRRPANPWLSLQKSFDRLGESAQRLDDSLAKFGEALRAVQL